MMLGTHSPDVVSLTSCQEHLDACRNMQMQGLRASSSAYLRYSLHISRCNCLSHPDQGLVGVPDDLLYWQSHLHHLLQLLAVA